MDDSPMPTGHLSIETARNALKITEMCDKINLNFGEAFTNSSMGDYIFFILGNEDSLCALGATPYGYFVEYENDEGVQYYMVKNIWHLLRRLKKLNMSGYILPDEDTEE